MKKIDLLLKTSLLLIGLNLSSNLVIAAEAGQDITAKTAQGDQVVLHPNGRWEFIDTKKAAAAKEVANQYEENQGCPNGTQGGFLGFGRCISKDDKDYNRGSLGGKGR